MVSWLEELDRREAAAREEIAELRSQMEELTRRLADREERLSRLEITRETMTEILSGDGAVRVSVDEAAGESRCRWTGAGRDRRSGCGWCRSGSRGLRRMCCRARTGTSSR